MKVIVVNESKKHIASKELNEIVRDIRACLLKTRLRNRMQLVVKKELTVVFLEAGAMRKINRQFRGKDRATDILSFAGADPDSLGELLLCIPVLRSQAKINGHTFRREAVYMLIHGILHLLGYDHERSANEERLMFRIQDRCFEKLEIR